MSEMTPAMRGMMDMIPAEHVEGSIAYRKAELAITEVQLPQWSAFADLVRANAKTMREGMVKMMKDGMPMTVPIRGKAMVQVMSVRLDGVRATVKADGALHAVLTPAQWKTVEKMTTGPMGAM